jgi:diguanylate cyclase (GGDEF)-like protein
MTIDRAMLLAARWGFEQLERDVRIDPLTGVGNRRAFDIEIRRELGRVARHGGGFCLVILDLDGLKAVNDTLGHTVGDARLQALGAGLRDSTRLEDSSYRLGGDEFALLMPDSSCEQAELVIRRVAEAAMPTRFSWGLSCAPEDGDTVEALVEAADARLYHQRSEARRLGRVPATG